MSKEILIAIIIQQLKKVNGMKVLKFFVVVSFASFCLFYLAASLIEATFILSKMRQSTRDVIFGCWLGVIIICMIIYAVGSPEAEGVDTPDNKNNQP